MGDYRDTCSAAWNTVLFALTFLFLQIPLSGTVHSGVSFLRYLTVTFTTVAIRAPPLQYWVPAP